MKKRLITCIMLMSMLVPTMAGTGPALAQTPEVYLNEIQVSTTGSPDWEFFELQGTPGTDLSDLTLVGIESDFGASAGTIDRVISLAGQSIPADGFWLGITPAGETAYGLTGEMSISDNSFENSTATYFLVSAFTAQGEVDLDANNDGVLDAQPWDSVLDSLNIRDADATDFDYGAPSVGPDGDFLPSGTFRCPDAPEGTWDANLLNFSTPDGTPGAANDCGPPPPPSVLINEVDSDTPSYDDLEFIELYDGGEGNTALDGLVVVLFNGSTDVSYGAFDLDGFATDADGYLVIGSVAGADLYVDPGSSGWLQNGADAVALYSGDAADFPSDTPVTTDGLVDALVYDTNDSDDADLLVLLNAGQLQINEGGLGDKDNHSNQRCPNGEGGARNTDTYTQFTATPRATNCELPPPPPPSVLINEVDSDTPSYDTLEFIELYDGGGGNTALDGLVVVLFNGSTNVSYGAFDLDGFATDADGYLVIGSVAGADLYVDPGSSGWLQNGADAVALYSGDAADFPSDTPVTTDGLVDALVYDTNDSDDADLLVLLNAGQPQINEGGSGDKDNHSNQRCPNGEGGARNTDTYTQFTATPRATNCELPPPPPPSVLINEVDADTPSYDTLEFIELYDGGGGNTALDGLVVVLYNGNGDVSYAAFDLDGYATDADGYFVIGSVAGADIYVDPGSGGWLQNGADAVALYSGDAAGFPDGTLVTTDSLLDALVYDTSDADDAGLLVLLNVGQPQINEGGSGDKDNHSNQRCPNGEGGARNTDTYTQFTATPRATNCELPPEACGDPFMPIYEIQGSGLASTYDGTEVSTEGIVVGDFQDGRSGFFIQDESGDGDAATSDGIFVYGTSPDVSVGDRVRVHGYVDEYETLTEITGVSQVWPCSAGHSVAPTPFSLPVTSQDDFEPFEGMLVTFPQSLYISEYYNFDRYGEIVLTTERQFQPTAVYEPGSPEAALLAQTNQLSRITLDDGRTWQNPDPALHPNGSVFDLTNLFRGGDTVQNVTGVVDYYYGYKLQPTEGADYLSDNPRTDQPDDSGGSLKVASFNVLNYFTTIDTGSDICGPAGDQGCRGADTIEEFDRQKAKIVAALAAIDADVVGLIEIENHPGDMPTADLVAGLNDVVGPGVYDYIATGAIGGDAIRQAFIYKPETVSLEGDFAVLDDPSFTNPLGYDEPKSRPALAQTFMDNNTGGVFTVAVNHLKSKGSSCGPGDDDPEQGSCNLTRAMGAQALVDWLATDPTESGDADVLIIGDLNAYDKEDPIDVILDGEYTDLVHLYQGEYAYSYVFSGQWGYLDHALANSDLMGEVTGATVWHINADEPDLIDYDMSYKQDAQDAIYAPDAYRSSDHDPVIAGLDVCDEIPPTLEVSVTPDMLWPPNHKYVNVLATVFATDNFDTSPTVELVSVTSDEPDAGLDDEDVPNDIVIVGDYTFQLRAERWDEGDGRTYTITYQVTDACGNSTPASAIVTVPHDQGGKDKDK